MEFYNPSEKIRLMRKKFRVNQAELEGTNMTRAFISMMESGKRTVSKASSKALAEKFNEIAKRISVNLNLDDEYFSRKPEEDARLYCEEQLTNGETLSYKKLDELMTTSKKFNLVDILARVYEVNGKKYVKEQNDMNAFINFSNALGKYKELRDDRAQASVYNNLGNCKYRRKEYDEAIFYYKQAIELSSAQSDSIIYIKASLNLALCYNEKKEYKKGLNIIDNNVLKNEEEVTSKIINEAKLTRAVILNSLNRGEEAVKEYFSLIDIIKDTDDILLAYVYNNLSDYYYNIEEYSKSLHYISQAQRLKSLVDKRTLPNTLNTKGKIFLKQGMYEESSMLFQLAIDIALEHKQYNMMFENYRELVNVYEYEEEWEKIREITKAFLENIESNNIELGKKYALYKLTEVSLRLGESEEAVNTLKKLDSLLIY
ncbi:tetratricopeptide repeat protein [Clostridium sp. C8-1-8]|uniref:tetratricopeptide repeat protein n=1 Tax=Clostridium sp. C8-1-8 TaxID=2698831 RepID=UPI00136B6AE4|nr:tetratricopeptide repeat protein [Clostridium sp. C8-1-8]